MIQTSHIYIHSWLNGVWGAGDTGTHGLYWASVTGEGSSGTAARVMVGCSCRGLSLFFNLSAFVLRFLLAIKAPPIITQADLIRTLYRLKGLYPCWAEIYFKLSLEIYCRSTFEPHVFKGLWLKTFSCKICDFREW